MGAEASGIIVKLPTDEKVLNDKWFKARGYKVGGKVAVVRYLVSKLTLSSVRLLISTISSRTVWELMHNMFRIHGRQFSPYQTTYHWI